jgi:hypothetical protein
MLLLIENTCGHNYNALCKASAVTVTVFRWYTTSCDDVGKTPRDQLVGYSITVCTCIRIVCANTTVVMKSSINIKTWI